MTPTTPAQIVLAGVLRLLAPLVRLLVQHGVPYTTFAAALKPVFVDAARKELTAAGKPQTDSAVTLLSGVHRRDIREIVHLDVRSARQGAAQLLGDELRAARFRAEQHGHGRARAGRARELPGERLVHGPAVRRARERVRAREGVEQVDVAAEPELRLGRGREDGERIELRRLER